MIAYLVMSNDFPHKAFDNKEQALLYARGMNVADEMEYPYRRIFYKVYECPLLSDAHEALTQPEVSRVMETV